MNDLIKTVALSGVLTMDDWIDLSMELAAVDSLGCLALICTSGGTSEGIDLARVHVPTIAVIERAEGAGLAFAARCDAVYALPTATLGLGAVESGNPFSALGRQLWLSWLIRQLRPQLSARIAQQMALGRRPNAEAAAAFGLIDGIVPSVERFVDVLAMLAEEVLLG